MSRCTRRVFIDTEFTNLIDLHLISIGLVSEEGEEFYAEVEDYPFDACNDFVREFVLPQLGKAPGVVKTGEDLSTSLLTWLVDVRASSEAIIVSYDYFGDWSLLAEALGTTPSWLRLDNVRGRVDEVVRNEFFQLTGLSAHHALHDARALRCAYRHWRQ